MDSQRPDSLLKVLQDNNLCILFREYLRSKYCAENLSFWIEVEEFRVINDPVQRRRKATEIHDKYFSSDSVFEINLEEEIKQTVASEISDPDATLFDEAQNAILYLMENDSLVGFLTSELYKVYSCK